MTEEEWAKAPETAGNNATRSLGPRRQRLLASAACRTLEPLLAETEAISALDVNDHFADTGRTKAALKRARQAVTKVRHQLIPGQGSAPARGKYEALWAVNVAVTENVSYNAVWAAAVAVHYAEGISVFEARGRLYPVYRDIAGPHTGLPTFDPSWRTAAAVGLAAAMIQSRDFGPMPVLADALEEAGCDDPTILDHCRDPNGTHVRGCWVVDLVLGKT